MKESEEKGKGRVSLPARRKGKGGKGGVFPVRIST